jgi:predicted transposase/invertase (TIGR01784 family)
MNHDELFKEMLHQFLSEFVHLFLPQEAAQLDFSTARFLEQETFTDFPDGELRRADVVVEIRTTGGETELLLLHIEVQSQRRSTVPKRMWEYYHLLRQRHGCKVYPIVLYLAPGSGGITTEQYQETVLGRVVETFTYRVVGLPDLSAVDYEDSTSPLAIALSALMRSSEPDKVERKVRSLTTMAQTAAEALSESHQLLLATIIDRYLPLSETEQATFQQRIRAQNPQENRVMSIYDIIREDALKQGIEKGIEQGIEQGIEKGIAQGLLAGEKRVLLRQLQAKFGVLPGAVTARINGLTVTEEIEILSDRILTANSLDEMGLTDSA